MSIAIESRRGVSLGVIFFELLPAALLVVLFATVGIVHVTSRVLVVKVGYQLSALDQVSSDLTREHDRLKLELATLRSPARLESIARQKLHMGPPAASAILHVKDL
jgi:cell division protein FtsL